MEKEQEITGSKKQIEAIITQPKNESTTLFIDGITREQKGLTESIQKEPELVLSWLSCLTELEQMVLSNLFKEESAISIKEIRRRIISSSVLFRIHKTEGNISTIKEVLGFPFPCYFILPIPSGIHNQEKALDYKVQIESVEKIFKFPSFKTIKNVVGDLERLNIVFCRTEGYNKKIKGRYYLNPIIRTQLQRIKEKKQKEKKERRDFIDKLNAEMVKASGGKPIPLLNY